MTVRVLTGDILDNACELDDRSIDLVFTSPPFWRQRAYLPDGHPDKHREIGTEATPGEFVDRLLDAVEAITPKLAPHGSMMWELGDTMAGSGGAGGDYNLGGNRHGQTRYSGTARTGKQNRPLTGLVVPADKSLCLIPELFRVALVYGVNPLTGRTTPPWRARNVVRWARNNPPVGSLGRRNPEHHTGDARYRPATTDLVVICKTRHRYFDVEAVRGLPAGPAAAAAIGPRRAGSAATSPPFDHWWHPDERYPNDERSLDGDRYDQDTWLINTRPYHGAHHATMPLDLPVIPILSMCPQRVCRLCGQPSERITTRSSPTGHRQSRDGNGQRAADTVTTLGWTECGCGNQCEPTTWHDDLGIGDKYPALGDQDPDLDDQEDDRHNDDGDHKATGRRSRRHLPDRRVRDLGACNDPSHWRPGTVLDPFGGSGTTAVVAERLGRNCILVDLDARNTQLAHARLTASAVAWHEVNVNAAPQLSLFAPGTA